MGIFSVIRLLPNIRLCFDMFDINRYYLLGVNIRPVININRVTI